MYVYVQIVYELLLIIEHFYMKYLFVENAMLEKFVKVLMYLCKCKCKNLCKTYWYKNKQKADVVVLQWKVKNKNINNSSPALSTNNRPSKNKSIIFALNWRI